MSFRLARLPFLTLLVASVLAPGVASARSLYGTVKEVKSAELLTVEHDAGSYVVRLYGVDTPDSGPLAAEAKRLVESLVRDRQIRVRVMAKNDKDEMVSQLLVDGVDIGIELLEAGLALRVPNVHYKPHAKGQPDGLVAAETEARLANRGLWLQPATSAAGDDKDAAGFALPAEVRVAGTLDRNTSQKSANDTECAIAIDPTNNQRLFLSCNTDTAGLFAARSTDGGATWIYPDATDKTIADGDAGQGTSACCDPTLAWDRFGNLYVTYISASLNSIVTLLSTDGGATYAPLATFTGSVDQPTVAASSVGADATVWVVWNQSGAMVARGTTATALGTVAAFPGTNQATGASSCSFGDIAVGPTGVVVQVCENPTGGQGPANLRMSVDADGTGAGGFGAVTTATTTNVGGFDFIPAQNSRSVDAEAGLAFDANAASPSFGRLYLVYGEEPTNENNDHNILVRTSDNNGTTWSAPILINDDGGTKSQFLPKIAIDPGTGKVGVCWHDARNSAGNNSMQLFCSTAEPTAGTPVFSASTLVSDGTSASNGQGVEFGDYMGLAFIGGKLHPVWADTSNSTADNPNGTSNFDAYTDRVPLDDIFADGFETGNTSAWTLTTP